MTTETAVRKNTADAAFWRLFIRVVLVLAALFAILFTLTIVSGPRLRQVEVDAKAVTAESGQRLTMHANQPLAKLTKKDVTVEPAVEFGVTNSANLITLTFKQRLDYHTRYRITVNNAASSYNDSRRTQFEYEFTTADPAVFYLRRAGAYDRTGQANDQIVRTSLAGGGESVAYESRRIQAFAVAGEQLAVVTVGGDGMNGLVLVDGRSGAATPVHLPARGTIDQLHSSPDGKQYGFRFSDDKQDETAHYWNSLFIHDPSPGHNLVALDGLAGQPLQVMDWRFSNDGTAIVAQMPDTNLLLLDMTFKHRPEPLGQFRSMGNFSQDGTKIAVRQGIDFEVLDIPQRQLVTAGRQPANDSLLGAALDVQLLSNQPGKVMQTRKDDGEGEHGLLTLLLPQGRRTAYEYDPAQQNLTGYRLTDNDQYVLAEEAARGASYDNYPGGAQPLGAYTRVINAKTGNTLTTIEGSDVIVQ